MADIEARDAKPGKDYLTTHGQDCDPPGPFRVRVIGRDDCGNVELKLVHNGVSAAVGPSYPLRELELEGEGSREASQSQVGKEPVGGLLPSPAPSSNPADKFQEEMVQEMATLPPVALAREPVGGVEASVEAQEKENVVTAYGLVRDILLEGGFSGDEIADQVKTLFSDVKRRDVTYMINDAKKKLKKKGIVIERDEHGKYQSRKENDNG